VRDLAEGGGAAAEASAMTETPGVILSATTDTLIRQMLERQRVSLGATPAQPVRLIPLEPIDRRTNPTATIRAVSTVATPFVVRVAWLAHFKAPNGAARTLGLLIPTGPLAPATPSRRAGAESPAEVVALLTQLVKRFVSPELLALFERATSPFDDVTIDVLACIIRDATVADAAAGGSYTNVFDAASTPAWFRRERYILSQRAQEVQLLAYFLFGAQPAANQSGDFVRALLDFKRRCLELHAKQRTHDDDMDVDKDK
jgi:hypothetical protein